MPDESETVTVWRAPRNHRIGAAAAIVVLLLLSVNVVVRYGYLATVGVLLVLAVVAVTWWNLLRPKLTAGPDGVNVVTGRAPVHLDWSQIRRCEPTPAGLKIICAGGREVLSRFPQQRATASDVPTEADATAAYLVQRAAWARKPAGPVPSYTAPPPPARTVRARPARS